MIRIGSSCALNRNMAIGKVVETRSFIGSSSKCWEVADHCIANKIYLIFTPCINRNDMSGHDPTDAEWRQIIENTCRMLQARGSNKNNCRLSIINEPMKYISKERYGQLINIAYSQVAGRFLVGAGNEEFFTAQANNFMYQYLLDERKAGKINFDILDIHIQGSCNTIELLDMWVNEVLSWIAYWKIPVDCTEAFYGDVATSKGWDLLLAQLDRAENKLHCPNFCNVFNDLRYNAFPATMQKFVKAWNFLCFKVNGFLRNGVDNKWAYWKILMDTKGPVPNIEEVFEMYGIEINYVKPGCHNEECRAVQQIMLDEGYNLSPYGADSWYGTVTEDAIRKWQEDNDLKVDGWVGKETWQWIMENINTGTMRFMQMIARTGRYK